MSEKNQNLRRRSQLDNRNQQRFEQEVAEEIDLSRARNRNQLGRSGSEATFVGPKSSRETGKYGRQDSRTSKEHRDRC